MHCHCVLPKGVWLSPHRAIVFFQGGGWLSPHRIMLSSQRCVAPAIQNHCVFPHGACGSHYTESLRFQRRRAILTTQNHCVSQWAYSCHHTESLRFHQSGCDWHHTEPLRFTKWYVWPPPHRISVCSERGGGAALTSQSLGVFSRVRGSHHAKSLRFPNEVCGSRHTESFVFPRGVWFSPHRVIVFS